MITPRTVLCVALAVAAEFGWAQEYPVKSVRVLIPWPTGGGNDTAGRIVAQQLSETTGQTFLVENRGGGSGTLGADVVAKSAPDGYTIMVHSATHVANAHLFKKLSYDTLKDFVAVAPISVLTGMLVVHPSIPVNATKELIALAKSKPGKLVYASSGIGAFPHLAMALLDATADTQMVHVAYKGGGPASVAIGSGEVHAMIATIASVRPQIEAKRVRAIAVTSKHRVSIFPSVPTIAESGVPGYEFTTWVGVLAPAGTPRHIVDKLNTAVQQTLRVPAVAEKLQAETLEPMFMTPEQFAQRIRSDYDKYAKVIKRAGATVN